MFKHDQLGKPYFDEAMYQEAETHYKKALASVENINDKDRTEDDKKNITSLKDTVLRCQIKIHVKLGLTNQFTKNYETALTHFEEAINCIHQLKDDKDIEKRNISFYESEVVACKAQLQKPSSTSINSPDTKK